MSTKENIEKILEKEFPDFSEISNLDTMRERYPRYIWVIKEHFRQSDSTDIPSAETIMSAILLQFKRRGRNKVTRKSRSKLKSKQKVTQKKSEMDILHDKYKKNSLILEPFKEKEEKKKIEFLLTKLNTTMSLPIEGTNLSYTRDILEKMDKCKISEHFSDLPQADLLLCNYELKQYGELGNEVDLNECKDKLEKIKAEKESKEKEDYIRTTDGIEILKNIEEKNERASKNLTEWNG